MQRKTEPGLLTVKAAAALVGVTADAFYDLEHRGAIGPVPISLNGRHNPRQLHCIRASPNSGVGRGEGKDGSG